MGRVRKYLGRDRPVTSKLSWRAAMAVWMLGAGFLWAAIIGTLTHIFD